LRVPALVRHGSQARGGTRMVLVRAQRLAVRRFGSLEVAAPAGSLRLRYRTADGEIALAQPLEPQIVLAGIFTGGLLELRQAGFGVPGGDEARAFGLRGRARAAGGHEDCQDRQQRE
jgi:hypothetical protein